MANAVGYYLPRLRRYGCPPCQWWLTNQDAWNTTLKCLPGLIVICERRPLLRFPSRVGSGLAFYVRHHAGR